MKVIFLGTPDFAVNVLQDLHKSKHEVVAVVTQPDKPVGRGKKIKYSAVKQYAIDNNIDVLQFKNIKAKDSINALKQLKADCMVTAAYGQILSQKVLDITSKGVFNVHASLLPKYRGAAPIQWAIIKGEKTTGITIMKTDIGMDTGDIILKREMPIEQTDSAEDVFNKLSKIAGDVLIKALNLIENNEHTLIKQDESISTHYPMLKKQDGLIDFNKSASSVVNLIRGVNPWPGVYTYINNNMLKVHSASVFKPQDIQLQSKIENAKAGQVVYANKRQGLVIKCATNSVILESVQPVGKKRMHSTAYLNGSKVQEGSFVGKKED